MAARCLSPVYNLHYREWDRGLTPSGDHLTPPPPTAKSKQKKANIYPAASPSPQFTLDDTRKLIDLISSFSTTNQPILDTTMKNMLISVRSSLHTDMMTCMQKFKTELGAMGERMVHVEQKMGEFASSHNSLINSLDAVRH